MRYHNPHANQVPMRLHLGCCCCWKYLAAAATAAASGGGNVSTTTGNRCQRYCLSLLLALQTNALKLPQPSQ
jgi:hypothetical protein